MLRELFEENGEVHISANIRIITAHQPDRYSEKRVFSQDKKGNNTLSEEAGTICAVEAMCRVFGVEKELRTARDLPELRARASAALAHADRKAFDDLRRDVMWLGDPSGQLTSIRDLPQQSWPILQEFLERLKAVAFTPFKVDADKWDSVAIELVFRPWEATVNFFASGKKDRFDLSNFLGRSPTSYSTILDFLIKICSSRATRHPILCELARNGNSQYTLTVKFNSTFGIDSDERARLRSLISPILQDLRDWRIFGANIGNWHGPFVDLASRMLGIIKRATPQNSVPPGCWATADGTENSIIALQNSRDQKFIVELQDDNVNGILTLSWH